jgi:hypothetical protein
MNIEFKGTEAADEVSICELAKVGYCEHLVKLDAREECAPADGIRSNSQWREIDQVPGLARPAAANDRGGEGRAIRFFGRLTRLFRRC